MSVTSYADDLGSAVHYALETTHAIAICPFHLDLTIRIGDDAAESHAFARARKLVKSDGTTWEGEALRKEFGRQLGAKRLTVTALAAPFWVTLSYKRLRAFGSGECWRSSSVIGQIRSCPMLAAIPAQWGLLLKLLGGGVPLGARRGPTTARLIASQLRIVGRTLSSAADAAGLGGIAGFNEGNSLQDRASMVKARGVTFQMLGKNRHIPESVVEIDFWRG